jgi:hypothetical protein
LHIDAVMAVFGASYVALHSCLVHICRVVALHCPGLQVVWRARSRPRSQFLMVWRYADSDQFLSVRMHFHIAAGWLAFSTRHMYDQTA